MPPYRRRLLSVSGVLYCIFMLMMAGTRPLYAQSSAVNAVQLNEIMAGELLYKTPNAGHYQPAVMLNSHTEMTINGMVAAITVKQEFNNSSGEWQEAVYAFPLPENSAVNSMQIKVADTLIIGEIKEKQQAKAIYNTAKKAGKRAALLEQQRPNLFTTQVANIPPAETVTVTITYLQQVAYNAGVFSVRFPMTLTPRYIPGTPIIDEPERSVNIDSATGWAKPTDLVPDADKITPFQYPVAYEHGKVVNPIDVHIQLDPGLPLLAVTSPSHMLSIDQQAGQYQVSLAAGRVSMDRDFILNWQPEPSSAPQAALFSEQHNGEHYALMMLVPPTLNEQGMAPLPKEQVFVIDTSGSMGGDPIRQAKQSLLTAVNALSQQDSFNIIEFNSDHHALFTHSVKATTNNINRAVGFIQGLEAGGGTEMAGALTAALTQTQAQQSESLRQVIFITDGAVGNEQQLFNIIHQQLANSRLFTVGIGSAPNSHFMRSAAKFGRGSFRYIANDQQIQQQMGAMIKQLAYPAMANLDLSINGTEFELANSAVPDLYHQQPLILTAKLSRPQGEVTLRGTTAAQQWQTQLTITKGKQAMGISSLWAKERITTLLDSQILGEDPQQIRKQVTQLALTHQLVSPYTSFVAVEQQIVRDPNSTLATMPIANVKPDGQQLAYPKTATNAQLHLLIGIGLLLLSVLVGVQQRRQSYR